MRITLELSEEQSWQLVAALGRAWVDALKGHQTDVAEHILALQSKVRTAQDSAYSLLHTSAK